MTESDIFCKTKHWVEKNYQNAPHLLRTAHWVKKIDPEANDSLVIAALTHDMERAFHSTSKKILNDDERWDDRNRQLEHGRRSAKAVGQFLQSIGVPKDLIQEVKKLIEVHEIGGSAEADLLRDADSISFLEINSPMFISWVPERMSKKQAREKFDYMFGRITDRQRKTLARPFYEKALQDLNQLE